MNSFFIIAKYECKEEDHFESAQKHDQKA